MALQQGQRVSDRYTLISRLGSGGMADVWLAHDEMLDRRVALKFLHERFAQDEQFVERFRREAQSAAHLQHPNVVGVYDRGEADGRHWIAMEYVEGAMLKDLIGRGLTIGESVEIIRQVLVGARFAHSRGIIHRDLKPQNVMVDGEGRARVTDFGIARAGASEITQTGSVLGTAQYLSPEQAQGLEVTAASDLYSIGVMLYEALTGEVPFEADTPVAVALKQISEQPRSPSQLNPQVSPALDIVVGKALAKEPENRFQSADEFLRALDLAEGEPSGAGLGATAAYVPVAVVEEPPLLEQEGWFSRRRLIVLGVIAALVIAAAVWALTRDGTETTNVPAVIEKTETEARSLLERRGFDVATSTVANCSAEGTVVEQDPAAGSEAKEGARVTLTVSLGLSVEVPPLRNETLAKARKQLQEENLLVADEEQSSRDVDSGRVIETQPAAGEEVECGSTVTLIVSKGANLITLPDVLGDTQESAEAELERLGLIVNVDFRDADQEEGIVIGENPGAGSELLRGDQVTIIVSTGAGSVTVPSVEGQSEDAASRLLQSRGLSVEVVARETDDPDEDGRVLDQAPSAGSRLRQGDFVTIYVGELVEVKPEPPTTTTTPEETTTTTTPPKSR